MPIPHGCGSSPSNAYDREMPGEQITPKKIYFISVEGVATEVEYLQGLSDYRTDLGIDSLVNVEVLRRKKKMDTVHPFKW